MASDNAFTDRERELMAFAWQCFEGEPKVNFPKLANMAGMSNPVSASNAWGKIKKKLAAQAGVEATTTPKKTPGGGKRKAKADVANCDDEEESPTKKVKATPKGKGGKGKKGAAVDGEDGEVKVKGEVDGEDDYFV